MGYAGDTPAAPEDLAPKPNLPAASVLIVLLQRHVYAARAPLVVGGFACPRAQRPAHGRLHTLAAIVFVFQSSCKWFRL